MKVKHFVKGSALKPARFWEYAYAKSDMESHRLLAAGYIQISESEATKYKVRGIKFTRAR